MLYTNMIFKKLTPHGEVEISDIRQYVLDFKMKHGFDVQIWIGTDSKQAGPHTLYVTTICMVLPMNHGVHVIYKKLKIDKVPDIYTRLFKEGELSLEVCQALNMDDVEMHLDYSPNPKRKSHNAGTAVFSWLAGLGEQMKNDKLVGKQTLYPSFTVKNKPLASAASSAADAILRNQNPRRRKRPHQATKRKK